MLAGAPGVGKSDLVFQACQTAGLDCVVFHPVVSDPTDFKGLPYATDGKADFLPYGDLRVLLESTVPTLAFLDDLGQAPATVQAACMQLLLLRRLNGHRIPDHVTFAAATNRRQDKAGVSGILEPVKGRFCTIIEVQADVQSWSAWAISHGVAPEVVAFVRFRPDLLHAFKPTADIVNSPCPRTWAAAGRLVKLGIRNREILGGAIGEGAALELVAFLDIYSSMPSIDAILLDPANAPVPSTDKPATLYAVACGLAYRASTATAGRIATYANRLPDDFSTLLIKDCWRRCPQSEHAPEMISWKASHASALT